ncbi:MAG: GDP-mannose 4,6-dehydratase [Desulfocapsa sp.]|nr:GDP-mannose 4,6-dehydratase [Desulfocapsa sp.]
MNSTILITGGCGFLGTSLIAQLLKVKLFDTIRVLDNFLEGQPTDLGEITEYTVSDAKNCLQHQGVVLIEGDIRDQETAELCCRDVDCIVHLAANTGVPPSVENPRMDMESNVNGLFNMLEAARHNKVSKFIFASSGAPAGTVEPPIHEELPPHPVSPYGASKLAGEGYCSAYYHSYGVNTVCLRFGNVFGPRSKKKSSVVAKFIRQALAGEECHIYGDGSQTRDFIYIDDLVNAIILSITKDVGGETFQIASGTEMTVDEIVDIIKANLKNHGVEMAVIYDSPRRGDVKRNYSDTSKAKKILGWTTNMDIHKGVALTINYFLELK